MNILFFLQVKLELSEPDIIFQPSLDTNIVSNFQDRMAATVEDVLHQCRLIPKLSNLTQPRDDPNAKVKIVDTGETGEVACVLFSRFPIKTFLTQIHGIDLIYKKKSSGSRITYSHNIP